MGLSNIIFLLLLAVIIPYGCTEMFVTESTEKEDASIKENVVIDSVDEVDRSTEETEKLIKISEETVVNEFHESLIDISTDETKKLIKNSEEAVVEEIHKQSPDANTDTEALPTAKEEKPLSDGNITANATENSEDATNSTSNLVSCTTGEDLGLPVELVNSTRLINLLITEPNVTNRRSTADCIALLFYARYCPFSSMAAPHFNALSRAFPDIKMAAVDAMKHHSFNTQYGIVGVPTVMLFHNGRPAAKFNDSEYTLEMFSRFITKYTGMEPQGKLFVTSADFGGPVPSVPVKETDYCLALSWIFILVCAVYFFSKSTWWRWIVETIQNTWREAEAQHEHSE